MPIETILLAVSDQDADRVAELTDTVLEYAAPLVATVVIGHPIATETGSIPNASTPVFGSQHPYVLSQNEYDEVLEEYTDGEDLDDAVSKHDAVQEAARRLADSGVEYHVRGVVGESSDGLVALAEETSADRLVIGGKRRSPTEKVVFGSVVQTVLIESPCPVTFVQDE
ncbi:universal stress protein [Natronolimnobius baerhuensis]|uniref:Universal stress protein n=1 Tax=Natronolimnobius baerhuensis TaxID=253108 RepID=A0A202E448_9EURY|nr:universal stress protein [Natronolimnobius baerhuensis]OVE82987.1 universal stress protein [Natronolimnobius baerhuensis]